MDPLAGSALRAHFADLPDPQGDRAKRHGLLDVVTTALCATICGADSWVEVERFGRAKESWLRSFLALPNGIPAHDIVARVFASLDPVAFEAAFLGWVRSFAAAAGGAVAIDGKTARRSHDRAAGRPPFHRISAWSSAAGLVLGQVATGDKSNEITTVPALLAAPVLDGCLMTIDAMGCQTGIALQIVGQGADDVLALKANQPTLHELVAHHFAVAAAVAGPAPAGTSHEAVGKDHGQMEVRRC